MLHIATGYMSILPDVCLQCRLPFKLVSHNFDSYIQLLYGDKSSSVEEDLSSMVMVRAGLRWLRFKVMKIRFGHVHWSSLNSLSHVPRDGQKVFSSPCAIVADPYFVLFRGCSDLLTIFIMFVVRYARMARQLPPYMPASYQADPPQKPPLGCRVNALLGSWC